MLSFAGQKTVVFYVPYSHHVDGNSKGGRMLFTVPCSAVVLNECPLCPIKLVLRRGTPTPNNVSLRTRGIGTPFGESK